MAFANDILTLSPDGTMTADITSETIDLKNIYMLSVIAIWSGTPTGNLILQVSNDGVNWVAHTTQSAGGAASSKIFVIDNRSHRYARLFYDFTSSTGVLTASYSGKGV